jgi:hypothetical protein
MNWQLSAQEATFASAPRKSFERQLLPRERPLILWWSKYSSRTKMRRENFLRDEEYSRLYFVLLLIAQHVPFALKVAERYAVINVRMRPTNASAPISELFSSTHTPISTPFSAQLFQTNRRGQARRANRPGRHVFIVGRWFPDFRRAPQPPLQGAGVQVERRTSNRRRGGRT